MKFEIPIDFASGGRETKKFIISTRELKFLNRIKDRHLKGLDDVFEVVLHLEGDKTSVKQLSAITIMDSGLGSDSKSVDGIVEYKTLNEKLKEEKTQLDNTLKGRNMEVGRLKRRVLLLENQMEEEKLKEIKEADHLNKKNIEEIVEVKKKKPGRATAQDFEAVVK